jgi:hypothetical protein
MPNATDDGTDLVIVVLNELACAGTPKGCLSKADYADAMPVAIAE